MTEPAASVLAELWQQLEACAGFRNPQYIEALAHWLELYEHRPWTRQGRQIWLARLQADRADRAACVIVLALLQEAKGQHGEAAIRGVAELVIALDADIKWFETILGRGTRPRQPWTIMARSSRSVE